MHDAFTALTFQLIPQGLCAQHQRDIAFAFAVGMADQAGFTVMSAMAVRRMRTINHQY